MDEETYKVSDDYLDWLEAEVDNYVKEHGFLLANILWQRSYWYNEVEFLSKCQGDKAHRLRIKMMKLMEQV
jgi:hypothetical protein